MLPVQHTLSLTGHLSRYVTVLILALQIIGLLSLKLVRSSRLEAEEAW